MSISDRDARLLTILRVGRDVSAAGAGISIREALRRVAYVGIRPSFKARDLRSLLADNPGLMQDWLRYSENKRTSGGWYVLESGEVGKVSDPAFTVTYPAIQDAVAEFVVRELDYWMEPDEFPPGWSKTIADLFAESKESGSSVGPPETDWARAYERSLLRPWARFPIEGDIYEACQETPISFLTHWKAPFTGGGDGHLPKGTLVRVTVLDWMREPISVHAMPVDAPHIENLLVSEADRKNSKYGGFSLSISTADLNRLFQLVETKCA
jgi:hypothetical protein